MSVRQKFMRSRPSYLLTCCAIFSVLGAIQVLTFRPMLSSPGTWRIAWCGNDSPISHWILLYLWSVSGAIVAYYLFCGSRRALYFWTIISYAGFWSFAFLTSRQSWSVGDALIVVFFALMIRSFRRHQPLAHRIVPQ